MLRNAKIKSLTNESPEEELVEAIHFAKQFPIYKKQLLPFLYHQHPFYKGRSSNETIRIRGFLFASFAHTGLAEKALPFVLEELDTSRNAYMVAAAAIAIRGLSLPRSYITPYLIKAIQNIKFYDDAVSFEIYKPTWPLKTHTSALMEICKTLQWMGSAARNEIAHLQTLCQGDYMNEGVNSEIQKTIIAIEQDERKQDVSCCELSLFNNPNPPLKRKQKLTVGDLTEILMEDQDQSQLKYSEYFTDKPSIVFFFYTRCDNPNKCSLTITRLGQLQKALIAENLASKVKIAAITYDPGYDRAFRIKSYGENRGVVFNEENKAFRIESGMQSIQHYFDSGVNYIGSIVNQHTVELFILDKDGIIKKRFVRSQWSIPGIITALKDLLNEEQQEKNINRARRKVSNLFSPILSLLVIFSPKCPLCWAFYLSILGISNIHFLRLTTWFLPVFILLLCISLYSLYKKAHIRNEYLPVYLSVSGVIIILLFWWLMKINLAGYIGIILIITGSLLNALSHSMFQKLWMMISKAKGVLDFQKRVL